MRRIERIVRVAARLAAERRGRLCSVDKANVLETSRLWRDVTDRVMADEFPEIELETLLVDAAAMHLLSRPSDFDVIVTENMFGDILTDEASMLAGSLGMLPSASLGDGQRALRAHSRLGPGHRRHGNRQSLCAPLRALPCCCATAWASRPKPLAVEQAIAAAIARRRELRHCRRGRHAPLNR